MRGEMLDQYWGIGSSSILCKEEKVGGRVEEVISNQPSWERREGKESFVAPLSFLLITFPPTGGEGSRLKEKE